MKRLSSRIFGWEFALVVLIALAAAWSTYLSPYYLTVEQILYSTRHFVFPGLLALGLAVVVILGEIDISLASILAVGAVLLAKASAFGLPIVVAAPLVVCVCACLGGLNGAFVARLGLPSLAVTVGTMGAYRGLAFIIGSETGYTDFDASLRLLSERPGSGASSRSRFLSFSLSLSWSPSSWSARFSAAAATRWATTRRPHGSPASTSLA